MNRINVALIGSKFMGRAHSNAWVSVAHFFDVDPAPSMHLVCARNRRRAGGVRRRAGAGRHRTTDWRARRHVRRDRPRRHRHAQQRPRRAGDRRPRGRQARGLREAARRNARRRGGDGGCGGRAPSGTTFVWFNYRRVPAVALAHQLVAGGALGRIYPRARRLPAELGWTRHAAALALPGRRGRIGRPRRPQRPHRRHGALRHRRGDRHGRGRDRAHVRRRAGRARRRRRR